MSSWNRRQLWAEHDAAHARRMWLQKLLFIVLLVTTWDVIAVLGQSFDLCLPEATIEPPSPRGAGDM